MNSTDVILKADKIQKIFPSKEGDVRAVDGVDLELRSGEVFGLVGEFRLWQINSFQAAA